MYSKFLSDPESCITQTIYALFTPKPTKIYHVISFTGTINDIQDMKNQCPLGNIDHIVIEIGTMEAGDRKVKKCMSDRHNYR